MTREEFNKLTEDEQTAFLLAEEGEQASISELTAERDSFKSENERLKEERDGSRAELQKTKELNYTLARQIKTNTAETHIKSDEELIYSMFKKGGN